MSNRVAISRVRGGDVESAVRDSVDLAGGFAQRVAAGSRVLIKPNLCKAARRGSGFVTMLRSVVLGCGSYLPSRVLTNAELSRMVDTSASLQESHVHDVIITKEAPNYRIE